MLKSVGVVAGSYLLSVVLVMATDPLLSLMFPDFVRGRVPSDTALMASTGFFVAISILCAWVCARFAPARPGRHVLWFFVLGEAMGIAAIIPNWGKGWPHWYFLSWLLTWPLTCYIGYLLGRRRMAKSSAATA